MIKALALALGLLLLPMAVQAENVGVVWSYSEVGQSNIIGYRIYNTDGIIELDSILPEERRATLGLYDCTELYIVAYNSYAESEPSDHLSWCPGQIEVPGNFERFIKYTNFRLAEGVGILSSFKSRWGR